MNIIKITIEEFTNTIYDRYIKLFPEDEQRDFQNIEKNYNLGIENFYKIVEDNKTIGFFLLERIKDYPYYLDYFAIYEEYQNIIPAGSGGDDLGLLYREGTILRKLLGQGCRLHLQRRW